MTEEHIKELISVRYIELIAASNGYKASSSTPDYGTDLDIKEVDCRTVGDRKRYFDTGRELKIQLKATTEYAVKYEANFIKYNLKADTYNDLIHRANNEKPLILVLFILPDKKDDWVNITDKELIVKKCAYWYVPDDDNITQNSASKQINIKKDNIVSINTLGFLFDNYAI